MVLDKSPDLFRGEAKITHIFSEFYGIFDRTSWMRRHKVWNSILFLAGSFICFVIFSEKRLIDLMRWFTHIVKYLV